MLTGILTIFLVLDCLLLILLILVQLPKKEAGMGTAFGGGATDALFGAGTGNVLTKITKYAATIFLVLALTLTILNSSAHKASSGVQKALLNPSTKAAPTEPVTPSLKAPPLTPAPLTTPPEASGSKIVLPPLPTNAAPPTATNPAAKAPAVAPAVSAPVKATPPAK